MNLVVIVLVCSIVLESLANAAAAAAAAENAVSDEHRLRNGLAKSDQHRRLTGNTNLINAAIEASLPTINRLINERTPDPLSLTNAGFTTTFPLTTGTCSGQSATVAADLTSITGLSSLEITEMRVQEGTENVCCGCPTTFEGDFTFDMKANAIGLNSNLEFTSTGANTCSLSTSGTSSMSNPTAGGEIRISGSISQNALSVQDATVERLTFTCGTVSTTVANAGDFESIIDDLNGLLGEEFCKQLQNSADALKTAINTGLDQVTNNWGYLTSAGYIARFMAANAPTIVSTYLAGNLTETMEERRKFLNEP